MAKKFYVTTPIYYVNDIPHIGHTCTTVAADAVARFHKLLGEEVFFLTGTDEHGAKVAESAEKAGKSPKEFCDEVSQRFQNIWPKLNIEYNYFIRTTNPDHEKIVRKLIQKIHDCGDIYKGTYEGLYCVGCEKFITETELVDGKCVDHDKKPIKQKEDNYFFRLSKYVPILIKALEDGSDPNHYKISPEAKYKEVLTKLKAGVGDLSISRAEVSWGIPIPWDKSQTIYVWIDALINYYSATKITGREDFWPATIHLIGKEILWFHAVIWPAMLIATGMLLPKEIFAHSFYTIDGQKMSKTLGNVISPEDLLTKFGVDGARYLILKSFPHNNDSDVGWSRFEEIYNADLANGLGNLVARVAKLCERSGFEFPPVAATHGSPNSKAGYAPQSQLEKVMASFRFDDALGYIWKLIADQDKLLDEKEPWKQEGEALKETLTEAVRRIREIAYLLQPFLPETAERTINQFTGPKIKSEESLFPRLKKSIS